MYSWVHSSTVHNSPSLEMTHMSVNSGRRKTCWSHSLDLQPTSQREWVSWTRCWKREPDTQECTLHNPLFEWFVNIGKANLYFRNWDNPWGDRTGRRRGPGCWSCSVSWSENTSSCTATYALTYTNTSKLFWSRFFLKYVCFERRVPMSSANRQEHGRVHLRGHP